MKSYLFRQNADRYVPIVIVMRARGDSVKENSVLFLPFSVEQPERRMEIESCVSQAPEAETESYEMSRHTQIVIQCCTCCITRL